MPNLSDASPSAQPNGLALRFQLATHPRRRHTDIVAHSVDAFPGSTGDDALALFRALRDGQLGPYLDAHPKARAFVELPKPAPRSLATQRFFSVQAFRLVDAAGRGTFVRYRIEPAAGFQALTAEELAGKGEDYLLGEVPRLAESGALAFALRAQVAEEGDVTDDSCEHWPEERSVVELGTFVLDGLVEDDAAEQKAIIFDPIPRDVPGLEPSADPLLDVRAAAYLISGRERRAA